MGDRAEATSSAPPAQTSLWLVRHGESVANIRATAAEREGLETIDVEFRDADVPLSDLGQEQAAALSGWLADQAAGPNTVWCSPYLRAEQTIRIALDGAALDMGVRPDERLRDRELGVLDLLTSRGVDARFPIEADRRRRLGKFFYRPPGGESWADVALRVRSFLSEVEHYPGGILVVAHDAVVMLFVYVCLGLSEKQLLDFAQTNTVANASVTVLSHDGDGWSLDTFSSVEHLDARGTAATEHQGDRDVHPR